MTEKPVSKTQERVLNLFRFQGAENYTHATRILTAANLPGDGVPRGETWRSVKKMTDEQLTAVLPKPKVTEREVAAPKFHRWTHGDAIAAAKKRGALNEKLRAAGYRWYKDDEESAEHDITVDSAESEWVLLDPDGNEVSVAEAKRRLGI